MHAKPDACDLCGLSLNYGDRTYTRSGKTYHFCCNGCRYVFQMLMEVSDDPHPDAFRETELFKTCQEMGIIPRTESDLWEKTEFKPPSGPGIAHMGGIADVKSIQKTSGDNVLSMNLIINNMWCPACAWVIEEALRRMKGVSDAMCHFSTDRVRCDYNPVLTHSGRIIRTIESLGYTTRIQGEETGATEKRREMIRFAVSAFLTMNVMMLSFSLYSGFFTQLSQGTIHKLSWPIAIMASVVLFYGGQNILRRAVTGIRSAAFSMETLITAGSLSAFVYSTFNLFAGSMHLYYDTASMLITLVLLGKMLEKKAKDEVQENLNNFFSLKPTKVRLFLPPYPDGRYVAAEQLRPGDIFGLEENEIVPADGIVLEGNGSVDESSLTGEAVPVTMKSKDRLRSGTRVISGLFKVRAEAVGEESTLGQMIRIMERALEGKTSLEGKTDIMLQWFVPVILSLAAGTGLVCRLSGLAMEDSLIRAVTVMVISCPCALGIAIPLARVAGITIAGRRGVLVRDFSAFEKTEDVRAFVFDKTGTITEGRWRLLDVVTFEPIREKQLFAWAASLEKESDHYIASEIRRHAEERCIQAAHLEDIRIYENGISGRDGQWEVKIGSRVFLKSEIETHDSSLEKSSIQESPERSRVFMSYGGRLCGIFIFGDRIKDGTLGAIERLRAMGYRLGLVSGDDDKTTKAIGGIVGIDEAHGGKMPQDKATFVRELQKTGDRVAMVGDGINDAPSLLQSDLAVAVHSGGHLGKEVADITLMRGDPGQILDFMALAGTVNRKVNQNLFFSFIYNVMSIPIAMSGLLTPLTAVCAMLLSSLTVIGNTLLLMHEGK